MLFGKLHVCRLQQFSSLCKKRLLWSSATRAEVKLFQLNMDARFKFNLKREPLCVIFSRKTLTNESSLLKLVLVLTLCAHYSGFQQYVVILSPSGIFRHHRIHPFNSCWYFDLFCSSFLMHSLLLRTFCLMLQHSFEMHNVFFLEGVSDSFQFF